MTASTRARIENGGGGDGGGGGHGSGNVLTGGNGGHAHKRRKYLDGGDDPLGAGICQVSPAHR